MSDYNSPAAAFSQQGKGNYEDAEVSEDADAELEMGGSPVPEDHPSHPDNKSEAVEETKAIYEDMLSESPDAKDAENVPDHECDDPDAPWM